MLSNRLAVVALGVACVVAAAGGGYIAVRQSAPASAASVAPAPVSEPGVVEAPAVAGVQETEGIVGSTPPPPSEPVKATPPPRASRAASNSRSQAPARKPEAPQTVARAEPPAPTLNRSWPSSASSAPAAPAIDASPAPVQQEEQLPEPVRAPEPPEPTFDELLVSADSVVGVQTETALSTERSHVEDRVEARVSRDVRVGGRVAIPAGTRVIGSVTSVERGGKMRERARLGIRFHTLAFAAGTETPITTETIYRYGDAPGNKSAAKIGGGAVAGAILGAIIGGGKGAAIGAATGAAGGGAAVAASDRSEATLPAGAEVTARILSPVTVTVER